MVFSPRFFWGSFLFYFLIFYVNYDKIFIFGEITMKLSEVLKDGIYVLKEKNIEDCNLKARLLLAFLLGKSKRRIRGRKTN